MSFLFGSAAELEIEVKGGDELKKCLVKNENGEMEHLYMFTGSDTVAGVVHAKLAKAGKKVEHLGIKVELIGQIELLYDRGNPSEFTSLVRELEGPGELTENKSYPFDFGNIEKVFETYTGANVRLRYFLRARLTRQYLSNIQKTLDFAIQAITPEPEINTSIKMEVGIEDCLHIEFEYNKAKYHLQDVVIGKIYFLLVRIKIKHMEIVIIKRESTGTGPNVYNESENIAKFEIMDGAPVRGESIPIRLFLSPYDLTPTYKNVHNKYSVKYYLNLVLVDEEDRRYFKQQEIQLWRKTIRSTRGGEAKTEEKQKIETSTTGAAAAASPASPAAATHSGATPAAATPATRKPKGGEEDESL